MGARVCEEDCAVLEILDGYRVVASRGVRLLGSSTLFDAFPTLAQDAERVLSALASNRCVLWCAGEEAVLFFSHWLAETGLVLAVLPNYSARAVLEAVAQWRGMPICIISSNPTKKRADAEECRSAYVLLCDIHSYVEEFSALRDQSMSRLLSRVAAFTGCKIKSVELGDFREGDDALLSPQAIAFLHCVLFHLRAHSGYLQADVAYRLVLDRSPLRDAECVPIAVDLALPCFRSFSVFANRDTVVLELNTLHTHSLSASRSSVQSRMMLRLIPCI